MDCAPGRRQLVIKHDSLDQSAVNEISWGQRDLNVDGSSAETLPLYSSIVANLSGHSLSPAERNPVSSHPTPGCQGCLQLDQYCLRLATRVSALESTITELHRRHGGAVSLEELLEDTLPVVPPAWQEQGARRGKSSTSTPRRRTAGRNNRSSPPRDSLSPLLLSNHYEILSSSDEEFPSPPGAHAAVPSTAPRVRQPDQRQHHQGHRQQQHCSDRPDWRQHQRDHRQQQQHRPDQPDRRQQHRDLRQQPPIRQQPLAQWQHRSDRRRPRADRPQPHLDPDHHQQCLSADQQRDLQCWQDYFSDIRRKFRPNRKYSPTNAEPVVPPSDPTTTTLVVGSSMVRDVSLPGKAKVLSFPGAMLMDLDRMFPTILEKHPNLLNLVLHIGTNDIMVRKSELFKSNFTTLLNSLLSAGLRVIVSGPLPTHWKSEERWSRLFALHQWMRTLCTAKNTTYSNNFDLFDQRPDVYWVDGLHLVDSGAELLSAQFSTALTA